MTRPTQLPNSAAGHHRPVPGLLRRLAAIFYDMCLLVALLFVATALILPFNAGEAFTGKQFFYLLYLLVVSFLFYGWFWTHGGQTLGMRAWKLKVLTIDGKPLSWVHAFSRFASAFLSWAFLGLGFLWIALDKNRRGWHDHLSKTSVFFADS